MFLYYVRALALGILTASISCPLYSMDKLKNIVLLVATNPADKKLSVLLVSKNGGELQALNRVASEAERAALENYKDIDFTKSPKETITEGNLKGVSVDISPVNFVPADSFKAKDAEFFWIPLDDFVSLPTGISKELSTKGTTGKPVLVTVNYQLQKAIKALAPKIKEAAEKPLPQREAPVKPQVVTKKAAPKPLSYPERLALRKKIEEGKAAYAEKVRREEEEESKRERSKIHDLLSKRVEREYPRTTTPTELPSEGGVALPSTTEATTTVQPTPSLVTSKSSALPSTPERIETEATGQQAKPALAFKFPTKTTEVKTQPASTGTLETSRPLQTATKYAVKPIPEFVQRAPRGTAQPIPTGTGVTTQVTPSTVQTTTQATAQPTSLQETATVTEQTKPKQVFSLSSETSTESGEGEAGSSTATGSSTSETEGSTVSSIAEPVVTTTKATPSTTPQQIVPTTTTEATTTQLAPPVEAGLGFGGASSRIARPSLSTLPAKPTAPVVVSQPTAPIQSAETTGTGQAAGSFAIGSETESED
jgi:hypothetical protein